MNFIEFESMRSAKKIALFVFLGWIIFNHFVRIGAPRSNYVQPSITGGMRFSQNDTMLSLDNFRVRCGKNFVAIGRYCPTALSKGCDVLLDGANFLLGLSE